MLRFIINDNLIQEVLSSLKDRLADWAHGALLTVTYLGAIWCDSLLVLGLLALVKHG